MALAPYLIAYLAAGFLLACGFLLNQSAKLGSPLLAALAITAMWPLFAFAAPQAFFKPDPQSNEKPDALSVELSRVLDEQANQLDPSLVVKLRETARSGEHHVTYFGVPGNLSVVLDAFWDENIPPSLYYDLRTARAALDKQEPYDGPLFSFREPDWYVGFSNEFLKCIASADGKLRGAHIGCRWQNFHRSSGCGWGHS